MTLELPGSATRTALRSESFASYQMPIGAWNSDGLPTLSTDGQLIQQVWKVNDHRLKAGGFRLRLKAGSVRPSADSGHAKIIVGV